MNSQKTGGKNKAKGYAETFVQRSSLKEVLHNNMMHFRIYNLDRFRDIHPNIDFCNKQDKIKHQWLNFFLNCVNQLDVPKDALPEIQEAFRKMKYGKERSDLIEADAQIQHEDRMRSEGKAEGFEEGIEEGKNQGIIIGEKTSLLKTKSRMLKQVKKFVENGMTNDDIINMNHLFTTDEVQAVRTYLKDHSDCSIDELVDVFSSLYLSK